jgi:hypothetical protein
VQLAVGEGAELIILPLAALATFRLACRMALSAWLRSAN